MANLSVLLGSVTGKHKSRAFGANLFYPSVLKGQNQIYGHIQSACCENKKEFATS